TGRADHRGRPLSRSANDATRCRAGIRPPCVAKATHTSTPPRTAARTVATTIWWSAAPRAGSSAAARTAGSRTETVAKLIITEGYITCCNIRKCTGRMGGVSEGPMTIDELARAAGTTTRNVRAYQTRGLLPSPRIVGRVGHYGAGHLARLRLIAKLQDQGFSLAAIDRLMAAWHARQSVSELL